MHRLHHPKVALSLCFVTGSTFSRCMYAHASRGERLGKFTHPDFVTSVHFHPLDDHIFLTGCFDKRLRLWKIPDGR